MHFWTLYDRKNPEMKKWTSPLLVWILGAGLWLIVAVDRSGGDTGSTAAAGETDTMPTAGTVTDTVPPDVDTCINVNRATAGQLTALPGIGPVIAERIVVYRTARGPFKRLADIERVKGIGPATLKKIGAKVCF
jgi:competence ComEA-like helix-hairpin-helix protein